MNTDGELDTEAGREPEPVAVLMPHQSSDDDVSDSAVESESRGLEDAAEKGGRAPDSGAPPAKVAPKRRSRSGKKPVAKPQTITELFRYVYRETGAGRKLNLARNLWDIRTTPPESVQSEIAEVRTLAAKDPFLDALANLMVELADIELKDSVRRQTLKLVQVAFASHELFACRVERLVEPAAEPRLTATEISHAAGILRLAELENEESLELSGAKRERLRVNAISQDLRAAQARGDDLERKVHYAEGKTTSMEVISWLCRRAGFSQGMS